MNFPFPQDPVLTQIAIAYQNGNFIADSVLPRIPVGGRLFKWNEFDLADKTTLPDTTVGRKGVPNEVEFGYTEREASVKDFGLDDVVPQDDINAAPEGYNPLGHAAENLSELILLDREKRVADLVFNPDTYNASNKLVLSAGDQWSDYVNSDPVADMMEALDGMIMRPNTLVLGHNTWSKLRRHPKMIAAIYPVNASGGGLLTREQVSELLEIENLLVGQSWINSAKPGQAPTLNRLWGNHAAFLLSNPLARNQQGITFGYTAQHGSRISGQIAEPKVGLRGAQRVRVGESVAEVIAAKDAGYLFANAVA